MKLCCTGLWTMELSLKVKRSSQAIGRFDWHATKVARAGRREQSLPGLDQLTSQARSETSITLFRLD